jgi:hypothetical protein
MVIKGHRNFGLKLGATGTFPKGKLDETDEGALTFAVARDGDNVRIDFGTPVAWLVCPLETAIDFAKALLSASGVTYQIDDE